MVRFFFKNHNETHLKRSSIINQYFICKILIVFSPEGSSNIYVIDKPIQLKQQDSIAIIIEIPDDAAETAADVHSFGYVALAFALYIAKYTLLPS